MMGNHYIYVGSITNAMRGRRLLDQQGIRAFLQRSAHPTDDDGCGYRLLISGDAESAVKILRNHGVRIIRISDAM